MERFELTPPPNKIIKQKKGWEPSTEEEIKDYMNAQGFEGKPVSKKDEMEAYEKAKKKLRELFCEDYDKEK